MHEAYQPIIDDGRGRFLRTSDLETLTGEQIEGDLAAARTGWEDALHRSE
jgi:hypothetical protein